MNVAWKRKLFNELLGYDIPFMADLQAYAEVDRVVTNRRPKYSYFCRLHFSNGDSWKLKAFTQRSNRCRAFEGICKFIEQYNGDQSIIFVTGCPLDVFYAGDVKSHYVGWGDIYSTLRNLFSSRSHKFGLQYLPPRELRHIFKLRQGWERIDALAARSEASASKQSQSHSTFAFLKKGGSEDVQGY